MVEKIEELALNLQGTITTHTDLGRKDFNERSGKI